MSVQVQSRLGGAGWRSSHVRNAPLATLGSKKAACRNGPKTEVAGWSESADNCGLFQQFRRLVMFAAIRRASSGDPRIRLFRIGRIR
jgi:hypothetical protein